MQSPGSFPAESYLLRQFPDSRMEGLWRNFLSRVECPAHYNSPEFFLEPVWKNRDSFALLLLCTDRVVAALTGFDHGWEVISGLPSRPQLCIVKDADVYETSRALGGALLAHFPNVKLITVYEWDSIALPGLAERGFRKVQLEGDVVLDLRPGAKYLFDHLPINRRRDIRKAIRNGLHVREAATEGDAEKYWDLYLAWKRTSRKRIHATRDFATLGAVQQMRTNHRRFLAEYKGEVIAASGIRFYPGGLVEYSDNCSRDEYLPLRPNDLLVWRIIEWSCEHGFPLLSLGASGDFHRKWSATIAPINRYRLDRTFLHRVELKEEITREARQLMCRLPVPIQSALKAVLRRAA